MGISFWYGLRFRFEEDNRYTVITTGFNMPEGMWSYNEHDRELLISSSGELDTYIILNFTDSRFEAMKKEDERILFFTRVP